MGLGSLRRYDVQARYAIVLSGISVVPLLGAAALAARNYDHKIGHIVHGATGLFLPAFLTCVALSFVLGAIGLALGINSANQRRNSRPGWSWTGFLLGSVVVTFNIILLIAYGMLRLTQPV